VTATNLISARDLARLCCPDDEGAFATLCAGMSDLPAAALAAYWEAAGRDDPGSPISIWHLGRPEPGPREVAAQRAALHARAEGLGVLAGTAHPRHLRELADRLGAAAHDRALALLGIADRTARTARADGWTNAAAALAGGLTVLRDLHAELPAVLGRGEEQFRARALGAQAIEYWRQNKPDPWADLDQRAQLLSWLSDEWVDDAREYLGGRDDDDAVLCRAYLLGAGAPPDAIARLAPGQTPRAGRDLDVEAAELARAVAAGLPLDEEAAAQVIAGSPIRVPVGEVKVTFQGRTVVGSDGAIHALVLDRDARQSVCAVWCAGAFGAECATSLPERGTRVLEEALELFQAAGCARDLADRVADRVFSRPAGDVAEELGQVGVTVLAAAAAAAAGLSADEVERVALARAMETPLAELRERHARKHEAGIAPAPPRVEP
jgi:hypothetical protein